MKRKQRRFVVAVSSAAVLWILVLLRVLGTQAWTAGANGNWIRVYPPPFEIMLLTIVAMLVTIWLWTWYNRDRVRHLLTTLDTEERERLVRLLALEQEIDPGSAVDMPKRKRQALREEEETEYLYGYDETSGAQSGSVRR
ncbi:MAG: hypothetical protein KJ065_22520 [Anaerolineae bacterium]|nr:hypothetical protein [Anaerolineae bacterium]